jgi:hypothetical protein
MPISQALCLRSSTGVRTSMGICDETAITEQGGVLLGEMSRAAVKAGRLVPVAPHGMKQRRCGRSLSAKVRAEPSRGHVDDGDGYKAASAAAAGVRPGRALFGFLPSVQTESVSPPSTRTRSP